MEKARPLSQIRRERSRERMIHRSRSRSRSRGRRHYDGSSSRRPYHERTCYKCERAGHIARDCRGRSDGRCFICNEKGHK